MAIIKFSGIISQIRGKLNGSAFSRNRFGDTMVNWTTPINPQSSYQQMVRSYMLEVSQSWSTLTDEERAAWELLASGLTWQNRLGDSYTPTGYEVFCHCNLNCLLYGGTVFKEAPENNSVSQPGYAGLQLSGPNLNLGFDDDGPWANTGFKIFISPCLNPGIQYCKSQYRMIKFAQAGETFPYDIFPELLARYTSYFSPAALFLKVVPVSTQNYFSGVPLTSRFYLNI